MNSLPKLLMSSKATLVLPPLEENLMTPHLLKLTLGDTNTYSKTLCLFGERALGLYVIICKQHKVDIWLKVVCLLKMITLSLSSMTAASKDMDRQARQARRRYQWVGADPAALQHREALPRECCCN